MNGETHDSSKPPPPCAVRIAAVAYLAVQGLGGLAWWAMLVARPAARRAFLASDAPDSTLLAFAAPDLMLYVGLSLFGAYALATRRRWAWPWLCVHAGAAVYAALYTANLAALDPHAWLGAACMAPSLFGPPWIAWLARPGGRLAC